MIFSFTMPVITMREAEKADADRIAGGTWQDTGGGWFGDERALFVDGRRVDWVLVLGSEDGGAVIPILGEHIDPNNKQQSVQAAQEYFNAWLAEAMTQTIKERS